MKLNLSADEVLSTTRAVRKRLDVSTPVPRALIDECLELACQAPNGINQNTWRWIVVDDPATIAKLGGLYKDVVTEYAKTSAGTTLNVPGEDKVNKSAMHLLDIIHRVPAMLIPLMSGRPEGQGTLAQAAMWGSIVPAAWSFCLALRERGLGTVWTTAGLQRESESAALLGIPFADYTQIGWFPIAYTIGTDFKKAWRKPVSEVRSYNRF